jgi:hypothetical protein
LLDPFCGSPLGISSVPPKQRGKKHGKGTVNLGDGFAKVAYESGRDSLIIKDFAPPENFDNSLTSSRALKKLVPPADAYALLLGVTG